MSAQPTTHPNADPDTLRRLIEILDLDQRLEAMKGRSPAAKAESASTLSTRALACYGAGFAAVGLALGLFVGWSSTPVVASFLPLLFGAIGGAGGLYLNQKDLDDRRTMAFGVFAGAFAILTVVGGLLGTSMRTGARVSDMLPHFHRTESTLPVLTTDPDEAAAASATLLFLRARWIALGATPDETDAFLRTTAQAMSARASTKSLRSATAAAALVRVAEDLETAADSKAAELEDDYGRRASVAVRVDAQVLAAWNGVSLDAVPRDHLQKLLNEALDEVQRPYWRVSGQSRADLRQAQAELAKLEPVLFGVHGQLFDDFQKASELPMPVASTVSEDRLRAPASAAPKK